jgi:hypothetical protein
MATSSRDGAGSRLEMHLGAAITDAGAAKRVYGSAACLALVAGMYVVSGALEAPLIDTMVRGWVLNPDAYPWWRLTSFYSVMDWLWMRVGVILMLACAVALSRRRTWASAAARSLAVIGIVARSVATGAQLLLWVLWERSHPSALASLNYALTGGIVVACSVVLTLLRARTAPDGAIQGASVLQRAG